MAAGLMLALIAGPLAWSAEPSIRVRDSGITDGFRAMIDRAAARIADDAALAAQGRRQEAMAKLRNKVNEKIAASLTDDQKTKWKDMLGTPAGDELLAKIRAAVSRFRR